MKKHPGIYILFLLALILWPGAAEAHIFPHEVNDVVYSKKHNKIFVVVNDMDPFYGNCLLQLNAETVEVERAVFVGSWPQKMELTSDENYVWISFGATGFLKRVNIHTFDIGPELFLGPYHDNANMIANYFVVLPGESNKVVVNTSNPNVFADIEEMHLYENGLRKEKILGDGVLHFDNPRCFASISNGDYIFGSSGTDMAVSASVNLTVVSVLNDGLEFDEGYNASPTVYGGRFKTHGDTVFYSYGSILDVSNLNDIKVIGRIDHDLISTDYGYAYSPLHGTYIYPNFRDNKLCLTHYDKDYYNVVQDLGINFTSDVFKTISAVRDIEIINYNRYCVRLHTKQKQNLLAVVDAWPLGAESLIDEDIRIYPNPVVDRLILDNLPGEQELYLFDVSGKLRYSRQLIGERTEFDLSGHSAGVYILVIKTGTKVYRYKIAIK